MLRKSNVITVTAVSTHWIKVTMDMLIMYYSCTITTISCVINISLLTANLNSHEHTSGRIDHISDYMPEGPSAF